MKVLFIGDIFGQVGKNAIKEHLPKIKKNHKIDFVIAQGENVTNRKGLSKKDYKELVDAGIDVFTMGNHVWANSEINDLIQKHKNIIRPLNVPGDVIGSGTNLFKTKNNKIIRVTSVLGITFNKLQNPWNVNYANNFFDSIDLYLDSKDHDYHIIDFHSETTSEKAVFSLYCDGKVNALVGTHTHVQTADERTLPKGTAFITDVGMTGPKNSAIGANYLEVYKKMRYNERVKFKESKNRSQFNAVIIKFGKKLNVISRINF